MFGFDFTTLPLAVNLALFAAGAVVIWTSGTKLAVHVDTLAERTGIGRAFLGLVLLAGITELPECVTSLSAISVGNAPLAINNLFGGIVMQTAILAVADMLLGRGSLSFFSPKPELLLEGILLIVLLSLVLAGIVIGDRAVVFGIGGWTATVFALYLMAIWLVSRFEADKHWRPVDLPGALTAEESTPQERVTAALEPHRLWIPIAKISLVILIAGTLLVGTSEALAEQTGIGSSFVGATLLAATTSLPELSTTMGAVRLKAYSMAFANIFGSNAIMVALLFLTDVCTPEGPILLAVDRSATFAAAVGIVVTALYLAGLVMRRSRVVLGMGIDSLAVLIAYALTLFGLYLLRNG